MILQAMRQLFANENSIKTLLARPSSQHSGAYVSRAPQGAPLSYLLLTRMDQDDNESLAGTGGSGWLYSAEVDVDAKANTYEKADALAKAVNDFFRNYSGTVGGVTIEAVIKQGQQDGYEDLGNSADQGRHIVTLDYQVQFRM